MPASWHGRRIKRGARFKGVITMKADVLKTSQVKSSVAISYDGSLEELATEISAGLNLPDFFFKNDSEPPHTLYAMSEVLGFETYLYESSVKNGFNFLFRFETTHNSESFEPIDQPTAELSSWFSEHMKIIFPFTIEASGE